MGIEVVSCLTGELADSKTFRRSHGAKLNLVQCSGSMTGLAKMMERDYASVQARFPISASKT